MKFVYSYSRVSSLQQIKKSGIQRQVERARQWATSNNYHFQETLIDQGLSGFKGEHVTKGELGAFIESVKNGTVPYGSILVVEALDRLSREKVTTALQQFLMLIESGIEIVTLIDEQRYSTKSLSDNGMQLMISLMLMIRANEESEIKSIRVSDAKARSYNNAVNGNGLVQGQIPNWLKYEDNKFIIIEDKAATLRLIFDLCKSGNGYKTIADILNDKGIGLVSKPTKTNSINKWTISKISRILKNQAVIGLHKSTTDRPDIEGYYPVIIDKSSYFEVRALLATRAKAKPTKENLNNLLSGLLVCRCGGGMSFRQKSMTKINEKTAKRSAYTLRCTSKTSKSLDCSSKEIWSYPIERLILEVIPKLNTTDNQENKLPAILEEIKVLETQQSNLIDFIMNGSSSDAITRKLKDIESEISKQTELVKIERAKATQPKPEVNYSLDEIDLILNKNNTELRKEVHRNLSKLIKKIIIQDLFVGIVLFNDKTYSILHNKKNDYTDIQLYSGFSDDLKEIGMYIK